MKNKNFAALCAFLILFLSMPLPSMATITKYRDKWWRLNFDRVVESLHYTQGSDGTLILSGGEIHCTGAGNLKCRLGAGYYVPFIENQMYSEPETLLIERLFSYAEEKVDDEGVLSGSYNESILVVGPSGIGYTRVFQVTWEVAADESLTIQVDDILTTPYPVSTN